MESIFMHQRANGFERSPNIDKAVRGVEEIPCPDSDTSLHLRFYLTDLNSNVEGIAKRIILAVLNRSIHQKVYVTVIPKEYGESRTSRSSRSHDLTGLMERIRNINRVDQVGIAFDDADRLLADKSEVDFYGMLYIMRSDTNKKNLIKLKPCVKTVYAVPKCVIDNSRYVESLNLSDHGVTLVEYSSLEDGRLVVNDHGFIYQIDRSEV
jgi:hypothetical protein